MNERNLIPQTTVEVGCHRIVDVGARGTNELFAGLLQMPSHRRTHPTGNHDLAICDRHQHLGMIMPMTVTMVIVVMIAVIMVVMIVLPVMTMLVCRLVAQFAPDLTALLNRYHHVVPGTPEMAMHSLSI
jgi:hypothetical protein